MAIIRMRAGGWMGGTLLWGKVQLCCAEEEVIHLVCKKHICFLPCNTSTDRADVFNIACVWNSVLLVIKLMSMLKMC